MFKLMLYMLFPPFAFILLKQMVIGPRSPGWGGAIEMLMAPVVLGLFLFSVAVWAAVIYGIILLVQHTSITFH